MTSEQALQLIDFEIDQLEAKERRFGLSVWVLVAATASMIWGALSVFSENPGVWAPATLFLVTTMLLLVQAIQAVSVFVAWYPKGPHKVDDVRIRPAHMVPSLRIQALSGIVLTYLVVAVLLRSPFVPLSTFHWWWIAATYSALAVLVTFGFIASYFDSPVELLPADAISTERYYLVMAVVIVGALAAPGCFALVGVVTQQEAFQWDAWRAACLVAGAAVLSALLLSRTSHRLSIEALITIRRDLAHNRIEPDVAARHVEITLAGIPLTGLIGDVTSPILSELRSINEESAALTCEMHDQIVELESNDSGGLVIDQKRWLESAKRRSHYLHSKKERAISLLDEFPRARKRLRRLRVSARARMAVDVTDRLLTAELQRLLDSITQFGKAQDQLSAAYDKAKNTPTAAIVNPSNE